MTTVALEPQAESTTKPTYEPKNPGSWDELHRKVRDLFPLCFDGAKILYQKGLSSHFQVSHTLRVSSASSGYNFGATYVGNKQLGPGESYPVLLGETDVNGNTSATFLHQFGELWRLRLQSQIQQSKFSGAQATIERRGRHSTYGLTVANLNLVSDSGIFVGHIIRRITERIDLGAELLCQVDKKQIPGGKISLLSYAFRYTMPNWIFAATLGTAALNLSYYHKLSEHFQAGVELETNFRMQESSATFAYMAEIPYTGFTIRASCDTNWSIGAVLERKIYGANSPFTLSLSGLINHTKSQGRFGIGFLVG
uniref:Uncharacterized protein n=1 Tax=Acrobeloides nanus TaxID=290746 RepID=A0A914C807_9BILA